MRTDREFLEPAPPVVAADPLAAVVGVAGRAESAAPAMTARGPSLLGMVADAHRRALVEHWKRNRRGGMGGGR